MTTDKRVIFLANQFVGRSTYSGGDTLAIEIIKRTKSPVIVIAPASIENSLRSIIAGKPFELVSSDDSLNVPTNASTILGGIRTGITYLKRAIRTSLWILKNARPSDTFYLTGDFICNSVPTVIARLSMPRVKICANFFHRVPRPRDRKGNLFLVSFGSWILQTASLFLLKFSVNRFFVLSQIGLRELVSFGVTGEQITISGAGVDKSFIRGFRPSLSSPSRTILFIGRLNVTKGAFDLIEILSLLKNRTNDFHCIFIGASSQQDDHKVREMTMSLGLEAHVRFVGFVTEEEKYSILSQSRVLALPSKEEGYGIVVQEALTLGVPVVCYKLPALLELFSQSKNIHYCDYLDQQSFAEKLFSCLEHKGGVSENTDFLKDWNDVYQLQAEFFD